MSSDDECPDLEPMSIQDEGAKVQAKRRKRRKKKIGGGAKSTENFGKIELSKEGVTIGALKSAYKPKLGRYMVASRDIKCGEVISEEKGAICVLSSHVPHSCGHCLSPLKQQAPQCPKCYQFVGYCSDACKRAVTRLHTVECLAVKYLGGVCQTASVDFDLIRLAVRVAAHRSIGHDSLFKGCENLEQHAGSHSPEWEAAVLKACEMMVEVMEGNVVGEEAPAPGCRIEVTAQELLTTCRRINVNSYSLQRPHETAQKAVGLFPLHSLCNHSCRPNMSHRPVPGGMVMVALRDIKEGEEACDTYVDLYAPRDLRRDSLQKTKYFECHCSRCSNPPAIDDTLTAMTCQCGATLPDKATQCPECKVEVDVSQGMKEIAKLMNLTSKLSDRPELALKAYCSITAQPIKNTTVALHANHHVAFDAHCAAANIASSMADYELAKTHIMRVIEAYESVLPDPSRELCSFYEKAVQILRELEDPALSEVKTKLKKVERVLWG